VALVRPALPGLDRGRGPDDAIWFAREKARPIKHSTAGQSVEDPYVRHVAGEIAARAFAARSAVLLAAEALEDVRSASDGKVPAASDGKVQAAGAQAAVTIAATQFIAIESAFKPAELLFDVGGGSVMNREYAFDRHWRNARTIANHNPRDWKLAVAGAYYLTAEEPPTTGLF
jgi:alkylation response protein AidB-like acyl-CoA dehydrogenase